MYQKHARAQSSHDATFVHRWACCSANDGTVDLRARSAQRSLLASPVAQVLVHRALRLCRGLMARGVPGTRDPGAKKKAAPATPSGSAAANPGDADHGLQPMQGLGCWTVTRRMGIDGASAEAASAAGSWPDRQAQEEEAEEDDDDDGRSEPAHSALEEPADPAGLPDDGEEGWGSSSDSADEGLGPGGEDDTEGDPADPESCTALALQRSRRRPAIASRRKSGRPSSGRLLHTLTCDICLVSSEASSARSLCQPALLHMSFSDHGIGHLSLVLRFCRARLSTARLCFSPAPLHVTSS